MKLTKEKVREIHESQLTDRELTVLWLSSGNMGRGEVAKMLDVSETRVSQIKNNIDLKLKKQGWI